MTEEELEEALASSPLNEHLNPPSLVNSYQSAAGTGHRAPGPAAGQRALGWVGLSAR